MNNIQTSIMLTINLALLVLTYNSNPASSHPASVFSKPLAHTLQSLPLHLSQHGTEPSNNSEMSRSP